MKTFNSWRDIPEFDDETAEAAWWEQNSPGASLMNGSLHRSDTRESTTITLRFDPRMLARIKRIARSRFLNYQSMMKQWLAERLEDELRRQ